MLKIGQDNNNNNKGIRIFNFDNDKTKKVKRKILRVKNS